MSFAYGIDFGTTNSLVAGFSDLSGVFQSQGKAHAFYDLDQQSPYPSVVRYFERGEQPEVGFNAKSRMYLADEPGEGAFFKSIKRRLGKGEEVTLPDGNKLKAWEVASEIFSHLRKELYASNAHYEKDYPIDEAVVTVPVDFDGRGRVEIAEAMRKAGIKPKAFVHEPFAALIGHFYDGEKKLDHLAGKTILVFDWGGGTLDLCLAEVSKDGDRIYELGGDGIADRAGDDFDLRIFRELLAEFSKEKNLGDEFSVISSKKQRLLEECERAKIRLSKADSESIILSNIYKELNFSKILSRAQFVDIIKVELDAAEKCLFRLLDRTGLSPRQVDHVLLAGGTSTIPAVAARLETHFGSKVKLARDPRTVIAEGAAIVSHEEWKLYNHSDISVRLSDQTDFVVLESGTELVPENSQTFTFNCVDSRGGLAHFFLQQRRRQGDDEFINIGQMSLKTHCEEARYRNLDRIIAEFSISQEGILECTAKSSSTGDEQTLAIHQLTTGLMLKG